MVVLFSTKKGYISAIEIVFHGERPINPQAVRALYGSVNWWPERTVARIALLLAGDGAIGAWDGEHLVGFARSISDRCFHAYIEDVVVHPLYQG